MRAVGGVLWCGVRGRGGQGGERFMLYVVKKGGRVLQRCVQVKFRALRGVDPVLV